MKTTNNNAKQTKQTNNSNSCERNPLRGFEDFHMDIKDEFTSPLDNLNCFGNLEQKMFGNIFNDEFNLLSGEEKDPRNTNEEQKSKENELNNGTVFSKVYCSSYNNINGQPHQECYQSQSIEQAQNGHNISEAREAYKNSDGVMKSAYQRELDKKGARFIKEKNTKTGQHNQHKILKGLKENEIDNFNKAYNCYSKKCGLNKNYKALNSFGPHMKINNKQISDGKTNKNRN